MDNDLNLLRPFNLEAAKAGAPICTRDGRAARFIAHVPECDDEHRVIAYIEGALWSNSFRESGRIALAKGETRADLCMAPLCWVEGRPVYPGGTIYVRGGPGVFKVDGLMADGSIRMMGVGLGVSPEYLTWTPPVIKREGWINVYPVDTPREDCIAVTQTAVFATPELAAQAVPKGRPAACTRIEWEEPMPWGMPSPQAAPSPEFPWATPHSPTAPAVPPCPV